VCSGIGASREHLPSAKKTDDPLTKTNRHGGLSQAKRALIERGYLPGDSATRACVSRQRQQELSPLARKAQNAFSFVLPWNGRPKNSTGRNASGKPVAALNVRL
jgi:hypothetical protein